MISMVLWRCSWCNSYRRRKWTRRHEFKSWTRLIAFHIARITLGNVWIQLFSFQLWVNSRVDWFFSLGEAISLREGKLCIQTCLTPLKNWPCVLSYPSGGLVNMDINGTLWYLIQFKLVHWLHQFKTWNRKNF